MNIESGEDFHLKSPDWATEAQRRANGIAARRKNEIAAGVRKKKMKAASLELLVKVPEQKLGKLPKGVTLDQINEATRKAFEYQQEHPGEKVERDDFLYPILAEDKVQKQAEEAEKARIAEEQQAKLPPTLPLE